MKLAISNIAWSVEMDEAVYELMKKYGYTGLEIAPTRIFPVNPYEDLIIAKKWACEIKEKYGFDVPSMQSIWYGKSERIFGSSMERESLIDYTKKAIDFANAINCNNLVFGCPRNRNIADGDDISVKKSFFDIISEYALEKNTKISMEANPPIYNTNFVNDTLAALELIDEIGSEGFKLNLDMGTMVQNGESVSELVGKVSAINHVHISEPGLKLIEKRLIHSDLAEVLRRENYQGYVSIEMGKQENISDIEKTMSYIKEIFG